MRKTFFQLFCLLAVSIVILSACNMPGDNAPQATSQPTTVKVTDTLAPSATPTESVPTETATVEATETLTPLPTDSPTPEPVTAEVARESNCRIGPAGNYALVATYKIGQKLEILGKDLGNGYIFVKNPDKPEEQCYMLASSATIIGDLSVLPKFTPPPSPTAGVSFKATFKKFDICKGSNFALFIIENTSSLPYRSAYIKVTDLKTNKSVEQVVSAFDLYVGCVLAKNIAPLDPGGSGYLTSPPLPPGATNDKLRAVIQVCTEKALQGFCIIQSVDIKP